MINRTSSRAKVVTNPTNPPQQFPSIIAERRDPGSTQQPSVAYPTSTPRAFTLKTMPPELSPPPCRLENGRAWRLRPPQERPQRATNRPPSPLFRSRTHAFPTMPTRTNKGRLFSTTMRSTVRHHTRARLFPSLPRAFMACKTP